MITLTASVGADGANHVADVRLLQSALNAVPRSRGGPDPALAVDGDCGPRTLAAIARFQLQQFGWTDRRVDPGRITVRRLAEVTRPNPPAPPPRLPAAEVRRIVAAPVPIDPDTTNRALGRILALNGEVLHAGRPARVGAPLMRGDRLGTLDNGHVTISLGPGPNIELGPNSLIILFGEARGQTRQAGLEAHLETGRLADPAVLARLAGRIP